MVGEQPDLGAGRRLSSSPAGTSCRRDRSAPARSGCSTAAAPTGVQVTEKVSFQKDAGEPAVSPDGKFLYYSKDVTPSPTFEYNKNPHAGIYAIVRRDLADRPRADARRAAPAAPSRRASRRTASGSRSSAASTPAASCSSAASRPAPSARSSPGSTRISRRPGRSSAPTRSTRGLPDSHRPGRLGRRQDLARRSAGARCRTAAGRRRAAARARDPVHRQGRADDHRGRALPGRRSRPTASRCGCCAAPSCRPTARASSTARSASCGSRRCPSGAPQAPHQPRRPRVRSGVLAPTAARSSTPRGATSSAAAIRTIGVDGSGGRDVVTTPGHYVEPSFSPDGTADRLSAPSTATTCAGPTTASSPASSSCRPPAATPVLVREEGTSPRFDAHRHAHLLPGAARRSHGARQRDDRQRLGDRPRALGERHASWCRRRTASGWRSRSGGAPTSRRCRRPAGRSRSARPRKAFPVARVSRDSGWDLHWSDAAHDPLDARRRSLHARPGARRSRSSRDGAEKPDEPEAAGVAIGFEQASDKPSGHHRAGRRAHRVDERAHPAAA